MTPEERMDAFFSTVHYAGKVGRWQDTPATDSSEDEPEGLAKSHIKAHLRRTPSGGVTTVQEHEDSRIHHASDATISHILSLKVPDYFQVEKDFEGPKNRKLYFNAEYPNLYYSPNRPLAWTGAGQRGNVFGRYLATKAPLPVDVLESLELAPVNSEPRGRLMLDHYRAKYGNAPVVLTKGIEPKGVVISPSAKEPGKYQVTYFDERGFSSDHSIPSSYPGERSVEEVVGNLTEEGYVTPNPDVLEYLMQDEDFLAGNAATHARIQKALRKSGEEACKRLGDKLGVDWKKVDLDEFCDGMFEEEEHRDVTHGDPVKTAKIVLSHLAEDKGYYSKLKRVGLMSKAQSMEATFAKAEAEFQTKAIMRDLWYGITKDAMKKFGVFFDLENYDPVGKPQRFSVSGEDRPTSFLYQACSAGGDWQKPVRLFRCQLVDGWAEGLSQYGAKGGCFVFIPSKEQGNLGLVPSEKKAGEWWASDDQGRDAPRPDDRACVGAVRRYLESLTRREKKPIEEKAAETAMSKAVTHLLLKARVKQHMSTSSKGTAFVVQEHEDKRKSGASGIQDKIATLKKEIAAWEEDIKKWGAKVYKKHGGSVFVGQDEYAGGWHSIDQLNEKRRAKRILFAKDQIKDRLELIAQLEKEKKAGKIKSGTTERPASKRDREKADKALADAMNDKEFLAFLMGDAPIKKSRALLDLLLKAHVRAYQRTTKTGKPVQVQEHDDKRRKKGPEKGRGFLHDLHDHLTQGGKLRKPPEPEQPPVPAKSQGKDEGRIEDAMAGAGQAAQSDAGLQDLPAKLQAKCRREAPGHGHEIQLTKAETKTLLEKGIVGFVSAGRNPNDPQDAELPENVVQKRTEELRGELVKRGFKFERVKGKYGEEEESFMVMVPAVARKELVELGKAMNQDSVIWSDHNKNELIFTTGQNAGKRHVGNGFQTLKAEAADFYTEIKTPKGALKFSLNFDFSKLVKALLRLLRGEPLRKGTFTEDEARARGREAVERFHRDLKAALGQEHGHYRTECSCGEVLSQCRCSSPDKVVEVLPNACEKCRGKTVGKPRYDRSHIGTLQGKIDFQGLPISIETRKGAFRLWRDPNTGGDGITRMVLPYGYVRGTLGVAPDGDHLDVMVGPHLDSDRVFVVHQRKAPDFTEWDEDKVLLGLTSAAEARVMYLRHYDDERFLGSMDEMSMDEFKAKIRPGKRPKMVKALQYLYLRTV